MNQIFGNSYIKAFKFTTSREASTFASDQVVKNYLSIDDSFGDYYYFYIGYHSLTKEKQFVLSFSSDEKEENLNFMYWNDLLVLDTAKNIYFIDKNLNIKASIEISFYLSGLFLINNDRMLILEEASFKVVNFKGQIVMSESLDLIEDFSINDNLLYIKTSEEDKVFELT